MENQDRQGPKQTIIPEEKYLSCSGCIHHKIRMIRPGRHPKYAHSCNHNAVKHSYGGFPGNIGENDRTPRWCPFLSETNKIQR